MRLWGGGLGGEWRGEGVIGECGEWREGGGEWGGSGGRIFMKLDGGGEGRGGGKKR